MSSSLLHGGWMHRYAEDSNLFSNIPKTMNECDVCNVHVSHDNKHPSTSNEHMNWKMFSFSWHQCKHEGRRESGTNSWKIDMFKCEMRIGWMGSFMCYHDECKKCSLCMLQISHSEKPIEIILEPEISGMILCDSVANWNWIQRERFRAMNLTLFQSETAPKCIELQRKRDRKAENWLSSSVLRRKWENSQFGSGQYLYLRDSENWPWQQQQTQFRRKIFMHSTPENTLKFFQFSQHHCSRWMVWML